MAVKFLDLYKQYLSIKPEIDTAIFSIIERSAYIGGVSLTEFESNFAAFQDSSYCVGVANGTDALEIAIEALNLPTASEIIVPANSFISSAEAVTRCGHKVVFADINSHNYTLDLIDVEKKINPNTKAIIAVHLYGQPCDIDGLHNIASKHDLRIIEDCAQAHGAEYKGKRVGALGDIGAFSFYPGKNLGAYGDAGAILTHNEELAIRCRIISNHGRIDKYNHLIEGRNSRLDGIQAAILAVKLKHLDKWVSRRNEISKAYLSAFKSLSDINLPVIESHVRHAFHLFVIRTQKRDLLQKHLAERDIETGIHYPIALPLLKAYDYLGQSNEKMKANYLDKQLLSLPMGEHLTDDDVIEVIDAVRSFFN